MTCLLSPWQLLSLSEGWSPMNPAFPSSLADIGRYTTYPSSDAESQPKKRASRAGTRSVSTLSAAQLDRKRANDREAQRAIRQRTKDHIEGLEKTIADLRLAQENAEKLLAASQQRSRDVEDENAFLRAKLSEAGVVWAIEPPQPQNQAEPGRNSTRSTSPAATHASGPGSVHSAETASHNSSALSLVTPRMGGAAHSAFWQPQPQIRSAPGSIHDPTSAPMASHMPNWRSHDGGPSQSMHASNPMPDSPHEPAPPPPTHQHSPSAAMVNQYSPWTPSPAYHGHVLIPKRETTPHQEPQHFAPPPPTSSMYPPPQLSMSQQQQQQQQQQPPPQPTYPPAAMTSTPPPQASYQGVGVHVHVNSPVVYQVPQPQQQQQPTSHPGQYQMASGHASPGMMSGGFPPPPMQGDGQSGVAPQYDPSQPYGQPAQHSPQYPTDSMGPPHQTPHYQNG